MANTRSIITSLPDMTEALRGVNAFYLALGSFVSRFSETEAFIQTIFWRLSGVKPPIAQAVFSGVRTEDAMNKINRLAAAQRWLTERKELAQHAFSQLGHINKLRNNVLHYGADLEGPDTWKITNKKFVHVPENISEDVISPKTLTAAENDLGKIELILLELLPAKSKTSSHRELFDLARKQPWQYTPPRPLGGRQKSRNKPP